MKKIFSPLVPIAKFCSHFIKKCSMSAYKGDGRIFLWFHNETFSLKDITGLQI